MIISHNLFHKNKLSEIDTEEKRQNGANKATKMKRYRDNMKTDTDKYEQMKKERKTKRTWKSKKKNKEDTEQNKKPKKKTNKQTKPFGAFYKRNEWGKNQSNSKRESDKKSCH